MKPQERWTFSISTKDRMHFTSVKGSRPIIGNKKNKVVIMQTASLYCPITMSWAGPLPRALHGYLI